MMDKNCRICFKLNTNKIISLLDFPENYSIDYLSILKMLLPNFELMENDSLPKHICSVCASELLISYNLVAKVKKTEQKIKNILEGRVIKIPVNDIENSDEIQETCDKLGALCDQCSFGCAAASNITANTCRFCGNKRDTCNICRIEGDNILDTSLNIIKEEVIEIPSIQYECNECGRKFLTKTKLKKHIKSHNPQKTHYCKECKWSFYTSAQLERHMIVNHSGGNNQCIHCQKTFKEKRLLRQHMITHNQQKRFNCQFCSKGFNLLHHLKNHEATHKK
ncbi:zinc finger protein 90-like [Culicoides brevitarsis]|uniref:zinc finger protein 90-like n=1 Tax=Culicoides brevitarsis TaxID=469753 RepID=UPI00307CB971